MLLAAFVGAGNVFSGEAPPPDAPGGEALPTVAQIDEAIKAGNGQAVLLRIESRASALVKEKVDEMLKANDPSQAAWTLGAEWEPVLDRLAAMPETDPALMVQASRVFHAFGKPSPQCLRFCHALMKAPEADWQAATRGLNLLTRVRANDEASRDCALRLLDATKLPEMALNYLAETFPRDDAVKAKILAMATGKNLRWRGLADRRVPKLHLSTGEARELLLASLKGLEGQPEEDVHTALRMLNDAVIAAALQFRGCLRGGEDLAAVQVLLESPDRTRRALGLVIGCAAFAEMPAGLAQQMLAAVSKDLSPEAGRPLACWVLLPTQSVSKELAASMLNLSKGREASLATAFFSPLLRSLGDRDTALKELRAVLGENARPDWAYWNALCESTVGFTTDPSEWRNRWTPKSGEADKAALQRLASMKKHLVGCLSAFPVANEVPWLIEQAMQDPTLSRDLMGALWCVRLRSEQARKAAGLQAWLKGTADGSKPDGSRALAAGLLHLWFGDSEALAALISDPKALRNEDYWSTVVCSLAAVDANDPRLDACRAELAKNKNVGTSWYLWLLDLRRGKQVGEPPLDALADALAWYSRNNRHALWPCLMEDCGDRLVPHLNALRLPQLAFYDSGRTPGLIFEFAGILDRIELAQRKPAAAPSLGR